MVDDFLFDGSFEGRGKGSFFLDETAFGILSAPDIFYLSATLLNF